MDNYKDILNRYSPMSLEEELAQAKPDSYKPTGEAFDQLVDDAIQQGQPYGDVDNRLVGNAYGEINPRSPKADINEKRLAQSLQQSLPDFNAPVERLPSQTDEIASMLSKYATGNEPMAATNALDMVPQKQVYMGEAFARQAAPYSPQFKAPKMDLGEVVKNEASQSIVPSSLVGTESVDDLGKGMSRALMQNKLKSIITNPSVLAGLSTIPVDMAANALGSSSGNVGAYDINTAGAKEGTVYGDLERGIRGSMDLGPMPDQNILDLFSKYSKTPFIDDRSNLGPLNKDSATEGSSLEQNISSETKKEISKNPQKVQRQAESKVEEANAVIQSPDTSDKEMEDAIKQRNMNQFLATMAQAAERIGYSMAGANAQVLKPDLSFTNRQLEQSDQPVKDLKDMRKSKKDKMDLQTEQAKSDPNSAISKLYKESLSKISPEMSAKVGNMSANEIEKAFPTISMAINAVEGREVRKMQMAEMEARRQDAKQNKADILKNENELKYTSRFNASLDKIDKEKQEGQKEIMTAKALASGAETSPQKAQSLAKAIVKAVEGRGARVSDKDVDGALRAGGVSQQAIAALQKAGTGTIPAFQVKDIQNMLQVLEGMNTDYFNKRIDEMVYRQGNLLNKTPEQVREESFIPAPKVNKTINPKIAEFAKTHNMSYEQANSLIESRKAKQGK